MSNRWLISMALAVVPLALAALEGAAAPVAAANAYDLRGPGGVRVSYSASSFAGFPLLHYADRRTERSFRDSEIRTESTSVGTLVTVRFEDTPDLEGLDFTLVVPRVNVDESREGPVRTFAFWTTQRTTIGGPDLVDGQVESYALLRLTGTARYLEF
jgi:hypothetical protein